MLKKIFKFWIYSTLILLPLVVIISIFAPTSENQVSENSETDKVNSSRELDIQFISTYTNEFNQISIYKILNKSKLDSLTEMEKKELANFSDTKINKMNEWFFYYDSSSNPPTNIGEVETEDEVYDIITYESEDLPIFEAIRMKTLNWNEVYDQNGWRDPYYEMSASDKKEYNDLINTSADRRVELLQMYSACIKSKKPIGTCPGG